MHILPTKNTGTQVRLL